MLGFLGSLLRTLLVIFILSGVTLAALLYGLPKVVPQETLRNGIVQIYSETTGKDIDIRGKVEIALVPDTYLRLTDATVREAARPDAAAHTIDFLEVHLDFLQSLQNRVGATISAKLDGKALEARVNLPTLARYNSGSLNSVDVEIRAPFALRLKGKFQGNEQKFLLRDAALSLDKTAGQGTLEAGVQGAADYLKGELKFSKLDLDELARVKALAMPVAALFMPLPADSASAQTPAAQEKDAPFSWPETPLDLGWVRLAKADVSLAADHLTFRGITGNNVLVKLSADQGLLSLALDRTQMFGGEAVGSLALDVTSGTPVFQHHLTLHDVDVASFQKTLCNCTKIGGTGDITLAVDATGNSLHELVGNLHGQGSFRIQDGQIKGVDVLGMADSSPASVRQAFYLGAHDTKVTVASATFTIEKGVLNNDDFGMEIPFSNLHGRGTIDLGRLGIHYRVTPVLGVQQIGLRVPMLIEGSLLHPNVGTDIAGVMTQELDSLISDGTGARDISDEERRKLKEELKQVRHSLMKKLPPEVLAKLRANLRPAAPVTTPEAQEAEEEEKSSAEPGQAH